MTKEDIYEIFDNGGLFSQTLENYEFREGQLNMALDVIRCYENNCIGAIEAGTGIGKSFAYLVPALNYAFEDPTDRTVIATSTINLQRQLLEKDIPTLFRILNKDCKVAIAVGRNNYLCLRRLSEEIKANILLAEDSLSDLGRMREFASNTETGLRTEFSGKLDYSLWSAINSDADFCMGSKCPYVSQCFYYKSKKRLLESSIIICNHHLLFVDSSARLNDQCDYTEDNVLPAFNRLVIDEAHNIERHATSLFTREYSSYNLKRQMEHIYDVRAIGSNVRGKLLDELMPLCSDKEIYQSIIDLFALVKANSETLNMGALSFLNYYKHSHLLITPKEFPYVQKELGEMATAVIDSGLRLVSQLCTFATKINTKDELQDFRVEELKVHIDRIGAIIEELRDFMKVESWNDDVHYLDIVNHGQNSYVTFNIAPLDVSFILKDALFNKIKSILCTSATMDLHDDFFYWANGVGLPIDNKLYIKKVYPSPFNYKDNLMLLTPYDTPTFTREKEEEYANFLCETIFDGVSSAGGGALILFTSIRLMDYVYDFLKPRFEIQGLKTFKQGEMDRYALLNEFKEDEDSVLFATDSFWEGVDVPGNTLRMVVITKLPFKMPDDPIYKARYRKLEEDGKSGFYYLSLPDATMKLKQGFGRLLRHNSDHGIVLILDSRIVTKSYGSIMLNSLPESYHPETETSGISIKIESFLYSK
ncbi:MAG: ATP-dependent DNA helicase [Sphaerochaetaceae bacterium]|nr:ATP-dependent DNA helicase [Sphaerochaetaceae bacterium]